VKEGEARLSLEGAMPQKSGQLELPFMSRGEAFGEGRSVEAPPAAQGRLRVNESKSAVDLVAHRRILGYSFSKAEDRKGQLRVADKSLAVLKARIRRITRRTGGRSMTQVIEELREYLPGWRNYFSLSEIPSPLVYLDKWIRHRLRSLYLKQWKRGPTA
jgi:RNA-directed DNA polymerase